MTESNEDAASRSWLVRAWKFIQWPLSIILLLMTLIFATISQGEIGAPGAPVAAYYASLAFFAVMVLAMLPPVFFRVSAKIRLALYGALFVSLIVFSSVLGQVQEAYYRTPEGAEVARERAADRAAREEERREQEQAEAAMADAENALRELQEIAEQQDRCLSWGGSLRELNQRVRDGLHNPDSFEHVSTRFIVPTAQRYNVEMTFRTENGFGAIRTGRVLVEMVPATCEIRRVSNPS